MVSMKSHPVSVDWIDSGMSNRWHKIAEVDDEPVWCVTYGVCVKKSKMSVVIAGSCSDTGEIGNVIIIPRSCVKSIKRLVPKE